MAQMNFERMKILARWAGCIGAVQSVLWVALSITAILFYNCTFDYSDNNGIKASFGDAVGLTLYHVYFKGSCELKNIPYLKFITVDSVSTTLESAQLYIWIWIYLVGSFFWFLSSVSMVTHIDKSNLKKTTILLYIWIFLTLAISFMDLSLGVIFGMDSGKFHEKSVEKNFNTSSSSYDSLLIAAEISSTSLMIIAFRGFVLWIINFGLLAYFFRQTLIITEIDSDESNFIQKDFSSDSHSIQTRQPIKAYDTRNDMISSISQTENHIARAAENPTPNTENSISESRKINVENADAIHRASLISNALLKERQSKFANYQQYPLPPLIKPKPEFVRKPEREPYKDYFNSTVADLPKFPDPDYTPPAPRKKLPYANLSSNPSSHNSKSYF